MKKVEGAKWRGSSMDLQKHHQNNLQFSLAVLINNKTASVL